MLFRSIEKGSTKPQNKIAKLSKQQVEDIAKEKMEDLNANDLDAAAKIIEGSARAMGLEVVEG